MRDALVRLFKAYDHCRAGEISLERLTSRWVRGREDECDVGATSFYSDCNTDMDWEARQARAGSRRMQRLFAASASNNGGKVTMGEFVGR